MIRFCKSNGQYVFIFNKTFVFVLSLSDGIGWIRIFGRGIAWKNIDRYPYLFSERNGYTKTYRIGKYSFKWLNKFIL